MNNSKTDFKKWLCFLIVVFGFSFLVFNFSLAPVWAEGDSSSDSSSSLSPDQERQMLEQQLQELENQIAQYQNDITKTQQQKQTLQNQISILKNKIYKLNLQIQQSNLMIKDVSLQITDTQQSIENTSSKIEDSKAKLAETLRMLYREDRKSGVEILLSSNELSDFFNNLASLESLNVKSEDLLQDIKNLKITLEGQKQSLDDEKNDLEKIAKIQTLQKNESTAAQREQEQLLAETKGKESEYQKMLAQTQQKAAEIRARIFELIGVSKAPTFGEALDVAKYVENLTGVRPAFLLAILEQESAIGQNVGQCYLADKNTGAGVKATGNGTIIAKVMSPTRDVPPFLTITQELGRDPFKTLVSCPMSFGWGGAMGPAQFIPSTWMIYRDKVKQIAGSADPWQIKDSFLAAALYLADYGATKQTRTAEWRAAMIYFSGSTNSRYSFYGDSVLSRADRIQGWIDDIEKANGS
jgi:peptidoglycan hydrolase CwlO-like protein